MDEQQEQYEADMSAQGQAEAEAAGAEAEAQQEAKDRTVLDLANDLKRTRNEWDGIPIYLVAEIIKQQFSRGEVLSLIECLE